MVDRFHIASIDADCVIYAAVLWGVGNAKAFARRQYPDEGIPSERTVCRIMEKIGLSHKSKRKTNGITKTDRNARKSENLIKRDFTAEKPFEKCVTDITEIPAQDGKLYVSAVFDCYDLEGLGLSMADHMKADLSTATEGAIYECALQGRA